MLVEGSLEREQGKSPQQDISSSLGVHADRLDTSCYVYELDEAIEMYFGGFYLGRKGLSRD
jgi:hypothetical protein